MVHTGIGDDDKTGFLERTGDVVGERTGGEATSNGLGTSIGGKLQDGTVAVGTCRDNADIVGVLNGSNDTGGENELFPGLADVNDVDTFKNVVFVSESVSEFLGRLDVPSARLFQTYGSICLSQFFVPMWHCAASRSWISSSVALRTDGSFEAMLCSNLEEARTDEAKSTSKITRAHPPRNMHDSARFCARGVAHDEGNVP